MARAFEAEDGPEDPPEDHAHSVHTCGWNGSLGLWRAEPSKPVTPMPAAVRSRLQALRAELVGKGAAR